MASISVVIPSLNDAAFLDSCLTALASGTRIADELVVVDNGSTDDTAAVARRHGARVVAESVRGVASATSAGFDAATGDVIARLDADSVPPADWVERVAHAFESDPGLEALTGPGHFYGGSAFTRALGRALYIGGYFSTMRVVLGHPPLFGSNMALRADAWRRMSGSVHRADPDIHDDFDIAFRLPRGARVRYDRSLVVGVSARPFSTWRGFARRIRMAFHTLGVNLGEGLAERRRG